MKRSTSLTIPSALTNSANAAAAQSSTTNSSTTSNSNNTLGPNSFITLLTAQLQAQDPLNPMDPSQMVDQLTQINSLQQLIQIQTDLQQVLGTAPASTSPSTSAGTQTQAA
jgi:flagellar basal-body rod modification protein FlgD